MATVGVLCAVLPDHLAFNTADCISGWLLYAVIHTPCVLLTQVTHRGKHGCQLGGEKSWRDGALGKQDLSDPLISILYLCFYGNQSHGNQKIQTDIALTYIISVLLWATLPVGSLRKLREQWLDTILFAASLSTLIQNFPLCFHCHCEWDVNFWKLPRLFFGLI